jgi:hypothetical protein
MLVDLRSDMLPVGLGWGMGEGSDWFISGFCGFVLLRVCCLEGRLVGACDANKDWRAITSRYDYGIHNRRWPPGSGHSCYKEC